MREGCACTSPRRGPGRGSCCGTASRGGGPPGRPSSSPWAGPASPPWAPGSAAHGGPAAAGARRQTFTGMVWGAAGGGASGDGRAMGVAPVVPAGGGFLDISAEPPPGSGLPGWLTGEDIETFVTEYRDSGFTGPLNWYRNIDRNWELTAAWHHAPVTVPALFIAGDRDLVISGPGIREILPRLRDDAPRLPTPLLLSGCGHWTQQERPDEVSKAMIGFIRELD